VQRPDTRDGKTCGRPVREPDIERRVTREIDAILSTASELPTLENVAARLALNVRTMQRRLGKRQLTFRGLLDECRRRRAVAELERARLPIAAVANRLGYSDPAHFARAFRRWTGRSPSDYRKAPP